MTSMELSFRRTSPGAMLCAILSDTLIFNSPTATPLDKKVVEELAKIAEVEDIEALGMEMFKAKEQSQ